MICLLVLCDFVSISAHDYHFMCVCVCVAVFRLIFVTLGMLFQVGRYYYDPMEQIVMNWHKLEVWPGYVTSIRHHEKELLLCVDLTHKVMRQDTVYNLLCECSRSQSTDYQVIINSLASRHPQFVLFKNESQWKCILKPQVEDP
jgi:hypothetical protein